MRNLILLLPLFFYSCISFSDRRIRGNGDVVSEEISAGEFSSIQARGSINILLAQGPEREVRIEADRNLLEYIDIYTKNESLHIETARRINLLPSRPVTVYITAPDYNRLRLSGACTMRSDGIIFSEEGIDIEGSGASEFNMEIEAPVVRTGLSGSSRAVLHGRVNDLELEASGASDLKSFNLESEHVKIRLSGASSAEVNTLGSLDVRASGASSVRYRGNPELKSRTSGASSIRKTG